MSTPVITKVTASCTRPGMAFELFAKGCCIVYSEPNDLGMQVIRFVMDEDNSPEYNVLIVPLDTLLRINNL